MGFSNPLIEEGFSIYLQRKGADRIYLLYCSVMGAVLFLWWPKNNYIYFLEFKVVPSTFTLVAISALGAITFLSARFGTEGSGRDEFHPLSDWINFTVA